MRQASVCPWKTLWACLTFGIRMGLDKQAKSLQMCLLMPCMSSCHATVSTKQNRTGRDRGTRQRKTRMMGVWMEIQGRAALVQRHWSAKTDGVWQTESNMGNQTAPAGNNFIKYIHLKKIIVCVCRNYEKKATLTSHCVQSNVSMIEWYKST